MKLCHANQGQLTFQLADREKVLLLEVLQLYPLVPPAYHQRDGSKRAEDAASRKLIEEALTERRQENKRHLQSLLQNPNRFVQREGDWQFSITRGDLEWLLQVLNDVRIGSWIALGSPDPKTTTNVALTPENAKLFWAMELCGQFESDLLNALHSGEDQDRSPKA